MKKIIPFFLLALTTTSCTYEDVVAYLKGEPNNLTEVEKEKVTTAQAAEAATTTTTETTTVIVDNDLDIDRGGGRPK